MTLYDLWIYIAVFPFVSSIVFYILAEEMDSMRRLLASIHGWAALLVLPYSAYIASQYPSLKLGIGISGILALGGLAAVSIFYAVAMVKARWVYHLLHIPTVLVLATAFVGSLFILADAH